MRQYIIPIFIPHLGCPYDCIYCNQKTIAAQQDVPAPAQVTRIIESYLHTMPPSAAVEVAFFGGSFTALRLEKQEEYLRMVQPFCESGIVKSIRVSTRPDCIDRPTLDLLAAYQVKLIELGVQSWSEEVLQASLRHYTPEDIVKSSNLIKSYKMDLGMQLMIGLPGDSHQEAMETTRQVILQRPQVVRIYPTLVIAGTPLARMCQSRQYIPLELDEAVLTCRDMFMQFQKHDIKVIRMGLYPGEELRRAGNVLAGPFHPSFGELVEQAVFTEQARTLLVSYLELSGLAAHLYLYVDRRDVSKMTGSKQRIIRQLSREFRIETLTIKTLPELGRDWIGISRPNAQGMELMLTRKEFLAGFSPDHILPKADQEEQGAS